MTSPRKLLAILLTACLTSPLFAELALDGTKTEKKEIRHSMIGVRDTLQFYVFKGQAAILSVQFGNKDETFPMTATVHLFPKGTTDEGLKKWINNQHSDGLFPEVPEPVSSTKIPAEACKVTSKEKTGKSDNPRGGPSFADYELKFSIKEHRVEDKFKLAAFEGSTKVHVQIK